MNIIEKLLDPATTIHVAVAVADDDLRPVDECPSPGDLHFHDDIESFKACQHCIEYHHAGDW